MEDSVAVNYKCPIIIGLCGRSGAGKGLVSSLFAELGIPSIDTDAVYRELTAPCDSTSELSECMKELVRSFGEGILAADNSLDRRAMAGIVFADDGKEKLQKLNLITHCHILRRTDELIAIYADMGVPGVVVDAPVLFESGYNEKCDVIFAVSAPLDVLKHRIMKRDGITEEMAEKRLASQKSDAELEALVDLVIVNDSSVEALREKVRAAADFAMKKGKR